MEQTLMPEPTDEQMKLVAKSYAVRERYWAAYTWPFQTTYIPDIDKGKDALAAQGIDPTIIRSRYADLFNKVNASFYHLQRLKENEDLIIGYGKEMAEENRKTTPAHVGAVVGLTYEPIEHEYEAMLVTLKSALDISVIILSSFCETKADDLYKLLEEIRRKKDKNDTLDKIAAIMSDSSNSIIIDEFLNKPGIRSKRNHAVHEGSLPTGTINIHYNGANDNISVLKTLTMAVGSDAPDYNQGQPLEDFCSDLFYGVAEIIIQIGEVLLGHDIERGDKVSIYDQKIARNKKVKQQGN